MTTTANARPVRLGIVGCGSVSHSYLKQAAPMARSGQVELVAACDVAPERALALQTKFGIQRVAGHYLDVVQAADVDLVLILTSMPEHGPIARAALEAGKHVLVEKPMAVSLAEAAELVALAGRSPGYLLPAPHVILSPTYQAIWKRLHNGDIGPVYSARALYGWSGPQWGKWFYQPGGGPLFDLGVYNITSLTGLLGPARRVMAMTGVAIPQRRVDNELIQVETEDNAHVLIDFGQACLAVVSTGFFYQQYRRPALELYGARGTLQMLGEDWEPHGFEMWQNEKDGWQVFDETAPDWPWTDGLRHLVESIQRGTPPIITPEHGFHVLEIMLKAQESGRTGRALDIDSRFTPIEFSGQDQP
ncbi:MAG: Gfo/Idh/MocA family oxidoreductase [Anaerolineales bacterium]